MCTSLRGKLFALGSPITRSYYADSIDLETMSLGFMPSYEASKLDEIEKAVAPNA